jgi:hypothetical protein
MIYCYTITREIKDTRTCYVHEKLREITHTFLFHPCYSTRLAFMECIPYKEMCVTIYRHRPKCYRFREDVLNYKNIATRGTDYGHTGDPDEHTVRLFLRKFAYSK